MKKITWTHKDHKYECKIGVEKRGGATFLKVDAKIDGEHAGYGLPEPCINGGDIVARIGRMGVDQDGYDKIAKAVEEIWPPKATKKSAKEGENENPK